jgi:serine/threonine protein kinase
MATLSTNHDLARLAVQSGVLDEKRLEAFTQHSSTQSASAAELAKAMVREGVLTSFQAQQLLRGRWRRLTIRGKYTVLSPLGAGGSGRVYLCAHRVTGCQVAIKVLSSAMSANPDQRERFYREARALTYLQHPNIVRAFDLDRAGKCYLLVMEYVPGSTLQQLVLKEGPLPIGRVASYGRQAALGLEHLHQAGLVHRDVKPANLLVDGKETVKILDFGLTRFLGEEAVGLTGRYNPAEVLGTADYLAPEQAINTHGAGTPADIYSLGATLYFALAGHSPFHGGTVAQKLLGHQMRPPTPIRSIRPEVPEGLAAVLERMMAKEQGQRFASAAEVADALTPWSEGDPPPVPTIPTVERVECQSSLRRLSLAAWRRFRPNHLRWAVLVLGGVVAGSLGVVQLFAALRTSEPPRAAAQVFPITCPETIAAPVERAVSQPVADLPPHITLGIPQPQSNEARTPLLPVARRLGAD